MKKTVFDIAGRRVHLYLAEEAGRPLVVLNEYAGDGSSVVRELHSSGAPDANVACVGGLDWDGDMTPWECPPLTPRDTPCTGRADAYLDLVMSRILPAARDAVFGVPAFVALAGYSLAGLFALYAAHRCDAFDRVASMSGSLWFPGFADWVRAHDFVKAPERIYLSLGDAEERSRHPLLKTVRKNTEAVVEHWRSRGLDVRWELNPGNHFKDVVTRTARGIATVLR